MILTKVLSKGLKGPLQSQGICFFSLADAGNTTEALRKLWEVNYRVALDSRFERTFPNFEEFQHITSNGAWFRPEGQLLAADGESYVGLSAVGYFADSNSAYNRPHRGHGRIIRGRKIALALLKLMTIRVAKKWGAGYIRTNNDLACKKRRCWRLMPS